MSRIVPDHLIKRKSDESPRKLSTETINTTTTKKSDTSQELDNTTAEVGHAMVDGSIDKSRRSHSRKRSESLGDQLGFVQEPEDSSGE
jgi:hypothetical protein